MHRELKDDEELEDGKLDCTAVHTYWITWSNAAMPIAPTHMIVSMLF